MQEPPPQPVSPVAHGLSGMSMYRAGGGAVPPITVTLGIARGGGRHGVGLMVGRSRCFGVIRRQRPVSIITGFVRFRIY